MVKGGGDYLFPWAYTSPAEEHLNVRQNVGMQDLTSMGEVDIKGPGAERLISRLLVANILNLLPGQVRYTTMCDEDGRIVDDVTVYKFGDEHFMVVTSSAPRKTSFRWIADHAAGMSAYVNDVSGAIALISVQGPRAAICCQAWSTTPQALLALRFFRFAANRINDTELIVSRSGYTGELGYELYVPAEEAASSGSSWSAGARSSACCPTASAPCRACASRRRCRWPAPTSTASRPPSSWGCTSGSTSPSASLSAARRCCGRRSAACASAGSAWCWTARPPPIPATPSTRWPTWRPTGPRRAWISTPTRSSTPSARGWTQIGRITSSARGHSVGKMLALAYLDVSHTWPGARVMVATGGGRPVPATVANTPFFDPQGCACAARPSMPATGGAAPGGAGTGDLAGAKGRKARAER